MTNSTNDVQALFDEGNALSAKKAWQPAIRRFEQVLEAVPDHEWALNNMGFCLNAAGDHARASFFLEKCLAGSPNNGMAHANLIAALDKSGKRFETIPWRRRLAELRPEVAEHSFALANVLLSAGCVTEAIHYFRRTWTVAPDHEAAISNYLLAINYDDNLTTQQVADEHFRLARRLKPAKGRRRTFAASKDPERRLRIAYLSCDFSTHPVGKEMAAILEGHDKKTFDVYCYHDRQANDRWTELAREHSTSYRNVADLSDDDFESLVLADQIDVLIELVGHTGGRTRLGVLARGLAPVQVSFLGYPTTTGLDAIDYRITDVYCDPPGQTEHLHSERLVRLQRGFINIGFPDELPPVSPCPLEKNGHVTLGSFNNPAKITPRTMETWANILHAIPDARLVAKYGRSFQSEWLRDRWRSIFASHGIAPFRITFLPVAPKIEDHFRAIGDVDIALDPFPYQGTYTTMETLAMSVPVLTLAGESYVRRASSALLQRLGFDELVTSSSEDYVAEAVALATDKKRLNDLREQIRTRYLSSEICDASGYARELEQSYRSFWRGWCTERAAHDGAEGGTEVGTKEGPGEVICCGMPRSGSIWVFDVCERLFEECYGLQGYRSHVVAQGREPLQFLDDAVTSESPTLLHLPEVLDRRPGLREGREAKCICAVRHPLDVCVSLKDVFPTSFNMETIRKVKESLARADALNRESDTLFLDFNEAILSPVPSVQRIAEYLGLQLSHEVIARVARETAAQFVRVAPSPAELPTTGRVVKESPCAGKLQTLYHVGAKPTVVNRNWQRQLTPAEQSQAFTLMGVWINSWPTYAHGGAPIVECPPKQAATTGSHREDVYTFDNGVKVHTHHLGPAQLQRYSQVNLHEPVEEEWFLKMLQGVDHEAVFMDIGAAIGYYTILAKTNRSGLEVHAFEPLELHRAYLGENLKLNGIPSHEVVVRPEAISGEPGEAKLVPSRFASVLESECAPATAGDGRQKRSSPSEQDSRSSKRRHTTPVTTVPMDSVIDAIGKRISLVKVDVQGHETEVLRGADKAMQHHRVAAWIIGTHGKARHDECRRMLESAGYDILYAQLRVPNQPDGLIVATLS